MLWLVVVLVKVVLEQPQQGMQVRAVVVPVGEVVAVIPDGAT